MKHHKKKIWGAVRQALKRDHDSFNGLYQQYCKMKADWWWPREDSWIKRLNQRNWKSYRRHQWRHK